MKRCELTTAHTGITEWVSQFAGVGKVESTATWRMDELGDELGEACKAGCDYIAEFENGDFDLRVMTRFFFTLLNVNHARSPPHLIYFHNDRNDQDGD